MFFVVFSKPVLYPRYIQFQERARKKRQESILFLEHPPVLTAGVNATEDELLLPLSKLSPMGVTIHKVSRGGKWTAHEPGQLVVYFHVDLQNRNLLPLTFLDFVKEAVVETIFSVWQLKLYPSKENPGLYREDGKKIVSMGFYFKRYFTSFGIAINLSNSLQTFQWIRPCGLESNRMATILDSTPEPRDGMRVQEKKTEWIQKFGFLIQESLKKYPLPNPNSFRWIQ